MELLWIAGSKGVKGVWRWHFDGMMNNRSGGEADVTSMGMKFGSTGK